MPFSTIKPTNTFGDFGGGFEGGGGGGGLGDGGGGVTDTSKPEIQRAEVVNLNTIRPMEEQPPETPVEVPTQDALSEDRRRRAFTDVKRTKKPVTSGLNL